MVLFLPKAKASQKLPKQAISYTVKTHYNDTRYNDTRYNDIVVSREAFWPASYLFWDKTFPYLSRTDITDVCCNDTIGRMITVGRNNRILIKGFYCIY